MSSFEAGGARRDISPHTGEPLGGFIARLSPAAGVADPLYVRAVVLRHGRAGCALIQADLLGFTAWQVAEVRKFAATQLGLEPESVLLSATHTHSGPATVPIRGCEMASDEYQNGVLDAIKSALHEAAGNCQPAKMETGRFSLEFGMNRREETPDGVVLGVAPEKPRPREGFVARITAPRQTVILYSYACHPYILSAENALASGDFPAIVSQELEDDPSTLALFLNGCAGDIAPLEAFQGMDALRREGKRMALAVLNAMSRLQPLDVTSLKAEQKILNLPYAPLPTIEAVEAIVQQDERVVRPTEKTQTAVQQRIACALREWAEVMRQIVQQPQRLQPAFCELQTLKIGSLALLGISGEPFFEIGERVRAICPDTETWPLGYTNAFCGYIPTREEISGGGYEVNDSWKYLGIWRPHPQIEELVVSAASEVVQA